MKNMVIIFLLVFFPFISHSYTWQSYCPSTIHANNVCFGVGSWKGVICSPVGMYLWEEDIQEWTYYTYGLPVTGAVNLNATQILVAMGCGTYSDGIYTFDLETKQFNVVDWFFKPAFIKYYEYGGFYFLGLEEGGLYQSSNGINWFNISYFDTIPCQYIDFYGEHIIVSEGTWEFSSIYISCNAGSSWNTSVNGGHFEDVKFNYSGVAYAILPGMSNSAGIYFSNDFGNFWEPIFWEFFISTIGYDAIGNVFMGWQNGNGIAMLENPYPYPYPELIFLNEGLPNLNINEITINPAMSAIAIFCCTDAGVYVCYDYMVGENENQAETANISIFPNPVLDQTTVNINLPKIAEIDFTITILNNSGIKVDEIKVENTSPQNLEFTWNKGNLPSGIYYLVVKTKNETLNEKFIIL
jgi:hypothetical protein